MKVFGRNTCVELFKTKQKILKVYLQNSVEKDFKDKVLSYYKNPQICDKDYLNKITNFKNHQGIVVEIEDFKYCDLDEILEVHKLKGTKAFIVVLDNIEDPQNLGSIIRTSVCAGADGIIIPKNHSASINETVYKVSVGAVNHIKICQVTNINEAIKKIKKENIFVYALEAGEKKIYDADLVYHTCLVVGSEGKGVSKLTKSLCDEVLSLPMQNKINSLNASVAGGIAIYEVVRQRS